MLSRTSLAEATRAVEDAFYVSVGAGVLAVQRAQVRRRELEDRIGETLEAAGGALPEPLSSLVRRGRDRLGPTATDPTAA